MNIVEAVYLQDPKLAVQVARVLKVEAATSADIKKIQKLEKELGKKSKALTDYSNAILDMYKKAGAEVPSEISTDLASWAQKVQSIQEKAMQNLYELSIKKEVEKLRGKKQAKAGLKKA